jgi:hypothetical protein
VTPKQFDALIRSHLGALLAPHGFSSEGSRHCTFWRKTDNEIFHFVMPDPLRHSPTYDIKVFASSPLIDRAFKDHFPDSLGIPSDTVCRLNVKLGVTHKASSFPRVDERSFLAGFENAVRPAILNHALPYLDAVSSVESLLSLVRNPGFKLRPDG